MANRSDTICNVALVGHGDTGKTTFAEHVLLRAGVIKRAGKVSEGNTVSDFDADERERGHSIDVAVLHAPWKGRELCIFDCPGYPDFSGVSVSALSVADVGAVFVNAAAGVGVNGRRMWSASERLHRARLVVINKCDHENADPEHALARVHANFGERCLPYNLPVGKGAGFKGVIHCFGDTDGADGETLCGDTESAREAFLEAVVEADDELLELYFEGGELPPAQLARALTKAMREGQVTPVLFCAGEADKGVEEVLDFLAKYAPHASAVEGCAGAKTPSGEPVELHADGPFVASVFKVTSDVHVGKLSFLRVWSGSLPADGMVWNSVSRATEKLAHPTRPQGKELEPLTEVGPGDVFCVAKIEDLHLGASVSCATSPIIVDAPEFLRSMVSYAVEPKSRGEGPKVTAALQKLADEDPTFTVERTRDTNELVISGRSTLHLDLVLKRLEKRFRLQADTRLPKVPLKETIMGRSDGHHRHKKQTGGRGQFAEVYLRIAPTERGSGFVFADKTVGGSIPKNFVPAIEKGVREIMEQGVIAGFPVVDVSVEIYDGKHHPVDSSEAAFKMAGFRAFRDAFEKSKPALLEPIMDVEIEVPVKNMGDVLSDLPTRRGHPSGMDVRGDHQFIQASVPLSEMLTYSTDLRSMTAAEGAYTMEFAHLGVVPANVAQQLIATYKSSRTEED